MNDEELIKKQKAELLEILDNDDFTEIIYASRVTPPDRHQDTNIYKKSRLRPDHLIKVFPVEKIVHHRDGDVTFVTSTRGVFRFVNTGVYHKRALSVMAVVHE